MSNYDDNRQVLVEERVQPQYVQPVLEEVQEDDEPRPFWKRFWWILPLLALAIAIPLIIANRNREATPVAGAGGGLFEIVDHGDPGWGTILREVPATFDAALFGWGPTSTSPNNAESNFITGGTNNIGGFSDPRVDELWNQITTATDDATVTRLTTEMEQILFNDGFGAVIFQWPGLLAWRDHVQNVSSLPFGMEQIWNFWDWNITDADGLQSVSLAWNNPVNGLHGMVPSAANNSLQYLINGPGFAFFNPELDYVRNTDFGTFEEVSVDEAAGTRTVRYTINPDVTWSDGTPVDAADMILNWATSTRRFIPDGAEFAWPSPSQSMETVNAFPQISDDGRTITFTYDALRSDWYFQFDSSSIPAHIVARRALGIQDPEEAKQALISAFGGPENFRAQDGTEMPDVVSHLNTGEFGGELLTYTAPDAAAIEAIGGQVGASENNAWNMNSMPADSDLLITMGPYQVAEWTEEFMRLERNPNFNWYGNVVGRPNVDEITIRFIGDPMAQIQALQNGELDIIVPMSTVDTLAEVQRVADMGVGVEYATRAAGTYEHVTLVMNNGGIFDPAHWGGNAETARLVRLAFLYTIPRQEIVDRLVRPLQDDAVVRMSFTQVPGAPASAAVTGGNDSATFNVQNLERARELLEEAGVLDQTPLQVRFLYGNNNARRVDQFALIRAAAETPINR